MGMPGSHDIADGDNRGSMIDENDVTGPEGGQHRFADDAQAATPAEQPPGQLSPARRRNRVQLAVYQATSRLFVAQKMSWISSMAAMRFSAASRLTCTFTSEHSLAAFQKVSCRSG